MNNGYNDKYSYCYKIDSLCTKFKVSYHLFYQSAAVFVNVNYEHLTTALYFLVSQFFQDL